MMQPLIDSEAAVATIAGAGTQGLNLSSIAGPLPMEPGNAFGPRPGRLDHTQAPLVAAVRAYCESDMLPFTTPGHKRGRGLAPEAARALGLEAFRADIPVANGIDDSHLSHDYLLEAERLAADAFGADRAFFLLGGSTQAILVALLAAAGPGEEILVARNAHKSVQTALALSGARPVYVQPSYDPALQVSHGVGERVLAQALDRHPAARAALVVSPTYFGVASPLGALAALCQARGLPLLVDEAWGPHFGFHPALPPKAMVAGADLAVTSIHKVLSGFSQASLLTVRGGRIDPERAATWVRMLQTTSPSALILASIDAARRQMVLQGRALLDRTLALADHAHRAINRLPGLRTLGPEALGCPGVHALDPTKLVIDVSGLGTTGYAVEALLRERYRIALEMSDHRRAAALLTIADDRGTVARLLAALTHISATAPGGPSPLALPHDLPQLESEGLLTPREALFAPQTTVPLAQSAGRIAAETITPYPPGIPLLAPGERIIEPVVAYLQAGLAAGMCVAGIDQPCEPRLRVVR